MDFKVCNVQCGSKAVPQPQTVCNTMSETWSRIDFSIHLKILTVYMFMYFCDFFFFSFHLSFRTELKTHVPGITSRGCCTFINATHELKSLSPLGRKKKGIYLIIYLSFSFVQTMINGELLK